MKARLVNNADSSVRVDLLADNFPDAHLLTLSYLTLSTGNLPIYGTVVGAARKPKHDTFDCVSLVLKTKRNSTFQERLLRVWAAVRELF